LFVSLVHVALLHATMAPVTSLRRVRLTDAEAAPLLASLTAEYEVRYGSNDEMETTHAAEFDPPDGLFLVVVDRDGTTIAGGGYRRHAADACEIKRMWTAPDRRRQGLAARVLAALEDAAAEAGYARAVLITGPAQPEAHAMYLANGYCVVPTFGPYDEATAYEKPLSRR
jgi:GNAT superfamily N-acetyltransferase